MPRCNNGGFFSMGMFVRGGLTRHRERGCADQRDGNQPFSKHNLIPLESAGAPVPEPAKILCNSRLSTLKIE
jgi:hypothetical protein